MSETNTKNDAETSPAPTGGRAQAILFGASSLGQRALVALGARFEIVGFVDNDRAKWNQTFAGNRVFPPEQLRSLQDVRIVVTSSYHKEITAQLRGMGLVDFDVFTPEGVLRPAPPPPRAPNNVSEIDRQKLLALRDRHKGEIGWLIGNGPSVRPSDLDQLGAAPTFCCNRFHLAYERLKFRPAYTISSDPQMIEDFGAEIVRESSGTIILASKVRPTFTGNYTFIPLKIERPMRFSEDPLDHIAPGGATLVAAAQLGYFMGIRRFFLYGVDHSFSFDKVAGAELARSAQGEGNHFISGYRSGKAWYPPATLQIEESYVICDEFLRQRGGWIKNASRTSQLPHLERVSFDDAVAGRF